MLGFLFKKGLKLTGLGLTVKELNDYRKKMQSEGKDPLSTKNFINEYGKPLYDRVTSAIKAGQGKAGGGMMEMRKKGMGLRMKDGGATFPDLSGDGKITQKDILMGRGVIKKKKYYFTFKYYFGLFIKVVCTNFIFYYRGNFFNNK